jgi:surface antigen
MKIAKMGLILALAASTALAGCASNNGYGNGGGTGINKEIVGTVGGAALGGLLGAQLGKDGSRGELIGTAAGVFIGGLIGNQIGAYMDDQDKLMAQRSQYEALERYPDGRSAQWSNPNNGNYGYTQPNNTYQSSNGQYCREYQTTVVIDGRPQTGYGTACRRADGNWQIAG